MLECPPQELEVMLSNVSASEVTGGGFESWKNPISDLLTISLLISEIFT